MLRWPLTEREIVEIDSLDNPTESVNEYPSNQRPSEYNYRSLVEIYGNEVLVTDNDKTSGLVWFIRVLAFGLLLAYFLFK